MRNTFLKEAIARDIDGQVAKVLRGLGNPDPPLKLELTRELLRLDRRYYSSTDDGFLQEIAHRMRVAGKQILVRPTLLVEAIKAWDLGALPPRSKENSARFEPPHHQTKMGGGT